MTNQRDFTDDRFQMKVPLLALPMNKPAKLDMVILVSFLLVWGREGGPGVMDV